ncbi:MAG: hypothetical protein ACREJG_10680 [Candidatus Rokuibacteriota bacterium]
MMKSGLGRLVGIAIVVTGGLIGCTRSSDVAVSPRIEEQTVALQPSRAPISVAFLTGSLEDLEVVSRVEEGTGRVVTQPALRGTLKLENVSTDQAARLISGHIEYIGSDGKAIPLADGRGDTAIDLSYYGRERLDPGMETSESIEVPFPAAALDGQNLARLDVQLTFIPIAYESETASLTVSLAP